MKAVVKTTNFCCYSRVSLDKEIASFHKISKKFLYDFAIDSFSITTAEVGKSQNWRITLFAQIVVEILESYVSYNNHKLSGVFHCFAGKNRHLIRALELGFFIGYDGNITYPENDTLRDLVSNTPLESLLLETDSPFLTPIPFRKTRNEPAHLVYIASEVAKIHNKTIDYISEITSHNALKLFRFF